MFAWTSLPAELKQAVVEQLCFDDVHNLSAVNQSSYEACLPILFKNVVLQDIDAVEQFLANVPRPYFRYIQQLELNLTSVEDGVTVSKGPEASAEALNAFLIGAPCLRELVVKVAGSIDHSIVLCFSHLVHLEKLSILNLGDEAEYPLSERLIVAVAASIRNLQQLRIERVSRSTMHAHDLIGAYPTVPLVSGDYNIPSHPVLGTDLSLPSLLRIPSLRQLVIRDTHLGDPRWATTPVACNIELLDVRSCCYETEEANKICIERIMAAVGRTVDGLSIDAAVASPNEPLPKLRKLYISEYHPVDSVVDTISNLSASPIESLSMQCFEDDVVDVCSQLQEFLSLRMERGSDFFKKLNRVDVTIAGGEDGFIPAERAEAMKQLQEMCWDLSLVSKVPGSPVVEKPLCKTIHDDECPTDILAKSLDGRSY